MTAAEKFLKCLGLSDHDQKRFCQCVTCGKDPAKCGCDERDEDANGMCKQWERRAE